MFFPGWPINQRKIFAFRFYGLNICAEDLGIVLLSSFLWVWLIQLYNLQIRNVVCNYTLPLHIDLHRVALNCGNVLFDRGRGVSYTYYLHHSLLGWTL